MAHTRKHVGFVIQTESNFYTFTVSGHVIPSGCLVSSMMSFLYHP